MLCNINVATFQTPTKTPNSSNTRKKSVKRKINTNKSDQEADRKTLENLHRKAQELLNIDPITSSSSDISSSENDKLLQINKAVDVKGSVNNKTEISNKLKNVEENIHHTSTARDSQIVNAKTPKVKKEKLKSNHIKKSKDNSPAIVPAR